MNSLDFDEFARLVASAPHLPDLRSDDGSILQPATEPVGFLPPRLRFEDGSEDLARVVLLQAPAAVGKSWMARSLSARSGNPLWDLSRFRVGSNFFTGTLAIQYGGAGFERIENSLAAGEVTLILDAADEALVGAGISNYEAAVRDLGQLISGGADERAPAAVILGRPETLELTAVLLEELSIPWRMYNVAYFDHEERRRFVRGKVSAIRSAVVDADVFRFVDGFTEAVVEALGPSGTSNSEVEEFLGYAPVLDALAAFYSEQDNPHLKLEEIKRDSSGGYAWDLLIRVVDAICERERLKLHQILSDSDPDVARAAYASFSREEQVRLLLASEEDAVLNVTEDLEQPQYQALIEAWERQFAEHPFRRRSESRAAVPNPMLRFSSVVFRDYCAAVGFFTLEDVGCLELAEAMAAAEFQPSPMFVRFVANVEHQYRDHEPLIPEALSRILDSVLAAGGRVRAFVTEGTTGPQGGVADAIVEVFDRDLSVLSVRVDVDRSEIVIGRGVGSAEIEVPSCDVRAGAGHRDFLIGEAVDIHCRTFICDSEDVRVVATEERPAMLEVERFTSSTGRVFATSESVFSIVSPRKLNYPWHAFSRGPEGQFAAETALFDAALDLRRLIVWFSRPSMAGRMTYPIEAMDTILRKGRASGAMFGYCVELGLITKVDNSYRLHEPANVLAIKNLQLDDARLSAFLEGFLRATSSGA